MTERIVYLNGSFVPESEAKVSVLDSGFRSGDGVYDATRTFGHTLFKLREHVERLYRSLTYTRIDCGLSFDEMERISLDVVERNVPLLGADDEYTLWQNVRATACTTPPERSATSCSSCVNMSRDFIVH